MSRIELPSSNAPLYEKVKGYILEKIRRGDWGTDGRIPGEPELARELRISRMTINRAMRELTAAKVLERVPGVGTFVAPPSAIPAAVKIHNIADEIVARNQRYRCQVLQLASVFPPRHVHGAMALRQRRKVYRSLIVHYADDLPAQLEDRYVLPDFAPHYLGQTFLDKTTTDYLHSLTPPTQAEHLIEAGLPNQEICTHLQIQPSEPCLIVTRRTWVGDTITSYMKMVHPGARFRLLSRDSAMNAI